MFILMSSAARSVYRKDILRAIAQPEGTYLQFRYDLKWVDPSIRVPIEEGKLSNVVHRGSQCIIAYIDQHDKTVDTFLIPCRFATLVAVEPAGSTVSITLRLEAFAYAENLQTFNTDVRHVSAGKMPKWVSDTEINGKYWLEITQQLNTVASFKDLGTWEKVVTQLTKSEDFLSEKGYYTVEGIFPVESHAPLQPTNNVYKLSGNREYEMRMYHFAPNSEPINTSLKLESSSSQLVSITSNSLLPLDTRYDTKKVRVKTGQSSDSETAVLSVFRKDGKDAEPSLEFVFITQVGGNLQGNLLYGFLLGTLLSGPVIAATAANPAMQSFKYPVIFLAWVLGVVAAMFATFKIKRVV